MGRLGLKYIVGKTSASIQTIVNEFEYGSTFSLSPTQKDILPSGVGDLKWVRYNYNSSSSVLELWIDDSFWSMDFFFEKFMTLCFYNLMDFGDIFLSEVDLSDSNLRNYISREKIALRGFPLKGTIFKPYYHQTTEEKVAQARRFMELGCNVFKNDECFFLTKKNLFTEAKYIQAAISSAAYFVPNITAYISDYSFIESLIDMGINIFMIDYLISGFGPVFWLKKRYPKISIWGHRIGYEPINGNISMDALLTIAQLSGVDLLHIGTPLPHELDEKKLLVEKHKALNPNFKPIFTITTPQIIDYLLPVFGDDAIYLSCGYYRDKDGEIDWNRVKKWCNLFK